MQRWRLQLEKKRKENAAGSETDFGLQRLGAADRRVGGRMHARGKERADAAAAERPNLTPPRAAREATEKDTTQLTFCCRA